MYRTLKLNKIAFIFIILSSFISIRISRAWKIKRAESVKFLFVEEKKPEVIFLFSGRVSLLSLPCSIKKALLGSPKDIKAEVDSLNSKEIHILLKKWHSQPSNLILKCESKVFLFNLIPSKNQHYDYVKILGHVSSSPFDTKSRFTDSLSAPDLRSFHRKDFKIRKILDYSWEDMK